MDYVVGMISSMITSIVSDRSSLFLDTLECMIITTKCSPSGALVLVFARITSDALYYFPQVSSSVVVSGPLWTGPLHDAAYLSDMLRLATEWGWAYTDGNGKGNGVDLEKLLNLMIEESDPLLPSGYIKLDEVFIPEKQP